MHATEKSTKTCVMELLIEANLEPNRISMMELLRKELRAKSRLLFSQKFSIVDVWRGSKNTPSKKR